MQATAAVDTAIEARGVSASFRGGLAIQDVSFAIPTDENGQEVVLLGPNGSGTSVMMRLIAGLIVPLTGWARVLGHILPPAEPEAYYRRVSYISESPGYHPDTRVGSIIRFTQRLYPGWDGVYAGFLFGRFEIPPRRKVGQLSKAERVCLQFMLTLPRRPKVLLIDQDLSALDDRMRDRIIDERVSSGPDGQIVLLSTSARE